MTSIAMPVRQSSVQSVAAFKLNLTSLFNLALLAAAALLVGYYVLSANGLAASSYEISSLRDDLAAATERQTELTMQSLQLEEADLVVSFAHSHNMVVAQDAAYLFENGNVALGR